MGSVAAACFPWNVTADWDILVSPLSLSLEQRNRDRSFTAPHTLFPPYVFVNNTTLTDEVSVLKLLFLTLVERGMTSAALSHVTVHCKTAKVTMGWPDWGKQGLEKISQQVHSYSVTKVTHAPIQVIWGSNWLLKQWKLAEMDNSHINHSFNTSPIQSFTVTLFPIIYLKRAAEHLRRPAVWLPRWNYKAEAERKAAALLSPSPARVTVVNTLLIMGCSLSTEVTNPQSDLKDRKTTLLKDQWPVLLALKGKYLHMIQWWNSKKTSAIVK